ncbi:MAG TPA: hypothetical protein H9870_03580 [Candidatus Corynebacterium avicola]|uniref:Uncharacterized protein n=1 Tax=Candidatus Corynebacterium avicola TaxID=2838527 RepID=A0A9D1RN95_9CORY|nr:hypothetical protein [Candidatus Corynebacterium avicola]
MGNNEWGSPAPQNNPWRSDETAAQPYPYPAPGAPAGAPQPSGGGNGGGKGLFVIIALVAVVALVVAALVIWGVFGRDGGSGSEGSGGSDGGDGSDITFVPVPETDDAEADASDDAEDDASGTAPNPSRPDSDDDDDDEDDADDDSDDDEDDDRFGGSGDLNGDRVTTQGFPGTPRDSNGVPAAQCNGGDTWVFAGTNGNDRAVVCQVGNGGDYYYRGYYNDGAAEHDIDMSRLGSDHWVTETVGSLHIEISSDGVRVLRADGSERSSRDFTWSADNS